MEENKMALNFDTDFLDEDETIFLPKAALKPVTGARPLSTEEIVIKQYKAGTTLKMLTTNHGLSYGKVYEILNSHGVKLRHGRYSDSRSGKRLTTMSQLEKSSIIMDYTAGFEVKGILERYNLNKHGLYSILDEANVPRRHKKQFIALDIETIQNAGKGVEEIFKAPVTPEEVPINTWFNNDKLHLIIKKSAFDEGVTALSFEYDLNKGTLEFKEEK